MIHFAASIFAPNFCTIFLFFVVSKAVCVFQLAHLQALRAILSSLCRCFVECLLLFFVFTPVPFMYLFNLLPILALCQYLIFCPYLLFAHTYSLPILHLLPILTLFSYLLFYPYVPLPILSLCVYLVFAHTSSFANT